MKNQTKPKNQGFATTVIVVSVTVVMLTGLAFAFRGHLQSLETQTVAQVKVDYAQKEEALLQALLYHVPNKAIGAMKRYSVDNATDYTWNKVFEESISLANAETAANSQVITGLGIQGLISANTGDTTLESPADLVSSLVGGNEYLVNAGNTRDSSLLNHPQAGLKLPAPLYTNSSNFVKDQTYPLITFSKNHSGSWTKGLNASVSKYRRYNLYQYPNIRFGYARPGDLFVAKRNWWAFSLTFGAKDQAQTGVPPVRKNYIMSIYEVPSQLPLSSAGYMSVGNHASGIHWEQNNVAIAGGVFANRLQTHGQVALSSGLFSARKALQFSGQTTVGTKTLSSNFDAMGVREQREAQVGSNFYEASLGGNVGKVVFVPINRGTDFLKLKFDGPSSQRISPTGWEYYSRGASQAQMRIRIRAMESIDDQIPTEVRFYYRKTTGGRTFKTYTRGENWPFENETGGSEMPFQTTSLAIGRNAMTFHLDRLPAFLASLGNAADITVNNSILIYPDKSRSTVRAPNIPSTADDLAVSLRGGSDLSLYTKGFSVVTDLRLYIAESLNIVPIAAPTDAGWPARVDFFPPVSLFSPEKRFGESPEFDHPLKFAGQLNSLNTDENSAFLPLDLKSGNGDTVNPNLITANLSSLRSPAELPPIHLMNWLVTIEEIHAGAVSDGGGVTWTDPTVGISPDPTVDPPAEDPVVPDYSGSTPEQVRDFVLGLAEVYAGTAEGNSLDAIADTINAGIAAEVLADNATAVISFQQAQNAISQAYSVGTIPAADANAMNATLQAWIDALGG